jgi:hypothetical protein
MFLKSLHGVMLGMAIVASRHIKVHPQCLVCELGPENVKHLLISCVRVKQVWNKLGLTEVTEEAEAVDRSRSVVLEHILCGSKAKAPRFDHLNLHELIVVVA